MFAAALTSTHRSWCRTTSSMSAISPSGTPIEVENRLTRDSSPAHPRQSALVARSVSPFVPRANFSRPRASKYAFVGQTWPKVISSANSSSTSCSRLRTRATTRTASRSGARIEARTGRTIAIGAVYATLARLEEKGFVRFRVSDPQPVQGGRARKYFSLTGPGTRALRHSTAMLARMIAGLSPELRGGQW